MVPSSAESSVHLSSETTLSPQTTPPSQPTRSDPPSPAEKTPKLAGLQSIRIPLEKAGLTQKSTDLLLDSWRPNTQKSYNTYIHKWHNFLTENSIISPSHIDVANFLTQLYTSGASYNTINLARSAVSAYLSPGASDSIGNHPVVCRVVKGVFHNRPPLPKYQETWDVDTVLHLLNTWPPAESLSLQQLTYRTVMLVALLTGQRGQTIHNLTVDDVKLYESKCILVYSSLLKQSRPGLHVKPIEIECFSNKKLCIVHHLSLYIRKTRELRKDNKLFISCIAPFKGVSRDTISRWIKTVLNLAGVDVSKYTSHSTRSASTTAMYSRGASMDCIMQAAGWTNTSTFSKFYLKTIKPDGNDISRKEKKLTTLSQSVLDTFCKSTKD